MSNHNFATVDGNEAAARIAHKVSDVIAIYPITPASPMGELADSWSQAGVANLWGAVPDVIEMQSEAGAAGAVHGGLQAGALTTTFTASQGLLLMIPNLYKVVGELLPAVVHVAARSVATHALSIFGDHSDVMAARQTGMAMLCATSVQEAHDLALVSHAATLKTRVPFLHFFDGFRTSHEVSKIATIGDDTIRAMIDEDTVVAHRLRALDPDNPVVRGTAQNPDVFFQAREAANPYHLAVPAAVQSEMDRLAGHIGRGYKIMEYHGHPEAERVIVVMGSAAGPISEAVDHMVADGDRVGVVVVRLYRPFDVDSFIAALPPTTTSVAVLDRTKEPGATGEPLYLDVVAALAQGWKGPMPVVTGGRYGLSSKEFTPSMATRVFEHLTADDPAPRREFTVGIVDDVTRLSLPAADVWHEPASVSRAVFYGLGSDGTVGANKNSVKIVGDQTPLHAQGYFVYDSKKSGSTTISHLRFSPDPIRSTYLITEANFVGVHYFGAFDRYDVLDVACPGATVLINSPYGADGTWDRLPAETQQAILDKDLEVHVVNASKVAADNGLGRRVNTVLQTCFFALTDLLPVDEATEAIKASIAKTYGRRGALILQRNNTAVDAAIAAMEPMAVPAGVGDTATATRTRPPVVPGAAPDFVQRVTAAIMAGRGDQLPVSALPVDGSFPTATTQWEKRAIAARDPDLGSGDLHRLRPLRAGLPPRRDSAQAGEQRRVGVEPRHRTPAQNLEGARNQRGSRRRYRVAVDHPGRPRRLHRLWGVREHLPGQEQDRGEAQGDQHVAGGRSRRSRTGQLRFLPRPARVRSGQDPSLDTVKGSQLAQPLFEFSGACSGCGETPYLKLLTQLMGDRLIVANATGCSSIYGGNLPTTPWAVDNAGAGSGVGELAVRGQRRVRTRDAGRRRPSRGRGSASRWPN